MQIIYQCLAYRTHVVLIAFDLINDLHGLGLNSRFGPRRAEILSLRIYGCGLCKVKAKPWGPVIENQSHKIAGHGKVRNSGGWKGESVLFLVMYQL